MNSPYREPPIWMLGDNLFYPECDVVFGQSMWLYATPASPITINGVTFVGPTYISCGAVFPARKP